MRAWGGGICAIGMRVTGSRPLSSIKRCGLMALERCPLKTLTRSAKGTVAEPGKKVRQKRGLHRAITAQMWSR